MTGKFLGKIDFAEYGSMRDYPFMIGLQLGFKLADGCGATDGGKHTINISKECDWEYDERMVSITASVEKVHEILEAAKVRYVSELINKPVEVEVEKNCFKDFRILTEVL